jgi:hypothetical protein
MGIVALFAAGAIVGGAIEHQDAGTQSTKGSIPNSATVQATAGQTVTLPENGLPGNGLHDQDVVRIVATGLVPGIPYAVWECQSGGSYDAGVCDGSAMDLLSSDASGTVRVEYVARKGPFGNNNVTCSTPSSCLIVIFADQIPHDAQAITVFLDFA